MPLLNTGKEVQIDLRKNTNKIIDIFKQWDRNSRTIEFEILEDGNKVFIDSEKCLIVFAMRKPDGWFIFNDAEIKENSIISVLIDEQITGAAGISYGEIRIYDLVSKTLAISSTFKIRINESVIDDFKIQSSYEYNALTNILLSASEIVEKAEETVKELEDKIIEINDLEDEWKNAENDRKDAENDRISNEWQREQDEQQRKDNEQQRNDNEIDRENRLNKAIDDAIQLTKDNEADRESRLNKAIDDAIQTTKDNEADRENRLNAVLEDCKSAADNAINSSSQADTAATAANEAADRANLAAEKVEQINYIDDSIVSDIKTWSSSKISSYLEDYVTQEEIDAILT